MRPAGQAFLVFICAVITCTGGTVIIAGYVKRHPTLWALALLTAVGCAVGKICGDLLSPGF